MLEINNTNSKSSDTNNGDQHYQYPGLRYRISTRFILWFIAVSLPPLLALTYISLTKTSLIVERNVIENLVAVADYEVEQIQKSVAIEEQHVELLSHIPMVVDGIEDLAKIFERYGVVSPEYDIASADLTKYLINYQENINCYDIFLISLKGDVLFSLERESDFATNLQTGPYQGTNLASVFQYAITLVETEFSDLAYYDPSGRPAAFVASPVLKSGILIGVIAIQIEVNKISNLVRKYPSEGTSRESILALKNGDELVFLTPLRFDPVPVLERKIKLGDKFASPMQQAVAGYKGAGVSTDYSGNEVLAVWRYLPLTGWGLVVKINTEEAFASVAYLQKWYIGLGCITFLFILLLSTYAARTISKPILALTRATHVKDITKINSEVEVTTHDELGVLATSFNKMISALKLSVERMQVEISERKAAQETLTASEQQLKASNQQLSASEQQLKASNQQLSASEQQLKSSNQQLIKSQQKLALHVQQTPLAVIEWNLDFEVTEWNKAAEKMFGYTHDEALGQHAAGLIIPESARVVVDKVWSDLLIRKGGTTNTNENITRGNKIILCEWFNTPLIDDTGKVVGVASLVMDITERNLAEQKAQDLASIVERSLNEIYIFDAETFKFVLVNRGARENIGYTYDEFMKLTPLDIKPEFSRESFIELLAPLKNGTEELINFDTIHQRKNGTRYDVEIHLQLSKVAGQTVFVAIVLDITETKRLQKLETRAERLETAGTIAGQVAHDFNNLLAPIVAYPDFIRDQLAHDNKAHAYLDAIENAANKIVDINQDLMTMGRRGYYNQEVLDLNRIVMNAVQELESQTKTVTCELDIDKDLMRIKGGNAQIHRMLTNLLINAQDAMDNVGLIKIKTENYYADDTSVVFGRVPKGEYIKLTVSDSGCGIPEEIINKIIDPFFSTKSANKKRGSGLGLSVVDAVIKDHKGYLDLSSKVGHGTSFFVYFPITRDGELEDRLDKLSSGDETVLVVDDDDIQRDVSSKLLIKLGYKVSTVDCGEKAIEFVKNHSQGIVILDMVMPGGIDGAETYRQLLEINPNQKAILLSGFSESNRVLEAQRLGAGAFVRKPVTRNIIARAVRLELDREPKDPRNVSE